MKIYTKTGDAGKTSLLGGKRVFKDALRIEAYGTVDEANSLLGLARALRLPPTIDRMLGRVQNELFVLGAQLASPASRAGKGPLVTRDDVIRIEKEIDRLERTLPPLKHFILPGGHPAAAALHVARTVCRRAERLVVRLERKESSAPLAVIYLNRLSDFLFVAARFVNRQTKRKEIRWSGR